MSLIGEWEQKGTFENMDAFLTAVGMDDPQVRGMITSLKPKLRFTRDGDQWTMETITPHGNRQSVFVSGDEIDYVSIVGRPVKSKMTVEESKLVEVHSDPSSDGSITNITRQVDGDDMKVVLTADGTTATALYTRVG